MQEADFALAFFAYTPSRMKVVEYTIPLLIQYSAILGKLGKPELDPWGFHLPLDFYVWLGIVATLIVLPSVISCLSRGSRPQRNNPRHMWSRNFVQLLRILLQQG